MVKTPEDLRSLAKVMREEGIGYFQAAPDGTVTVYLAPGAAGMPTRIQRPDDDGEAAAAEAEDGGKERKPPRTPYDDADLWPGGRVPRLRRPVDPERPPDPGETL